MSDTPVLQYACAPPAVTAAPERSARVQESESSRQGGETREHELPANNIRLVARRRPVAAACASELARVCVIITSKLSVCLSRVAGCTSISPWWPSAPPPPPTPSARGDVCVGRGYASSFASTSLSLTLACVAFILEARIWYFGSWVFL